MKLASLVATGLTTAALGGFFALSAPTVEAARPAGPDMFDLDPVHSSVNFRVMHKGASWATGRFNKLTGELQWAPESLEDCAVTFEIDPSSVDTNDELVVIRDPKDGANIELRTANDLVQLGQWHHLALNFGAGGLKLYLDGVEVGSESFRIRDNKETTRALSDGVFDEVDEIVISASGGVIVDELTLIV